tara:strand:+ start:903 stop:2234 length:1332 start_codon:yes stop_codon:yes gene_type:complete
MSNTLPKLFIKLNIKNHEELGLGYSNVNFNTLLYSWEKILQQNRPKVIKDKLIYDKDKNETYIYFTSNKLFKALFEDKEEAQKILTNKKDFSEIFDKTLLSRPKDDLDSKLTNLRNTTIKNMNYVIDLFFSKEKSIYLGIKDKSSNKITKFEQFKFHSAAKIKPLPPPSLSKDIQKRINTIKIYLEKIDKRDNKYRELLNSSELKIQELQQKLQQIKLKQKGFNDVADDDDVAAKWTRMAWGVAIKETSKKINKYKKMAWDIAIKKITKKINKYKEQKEYNKNLKKKYLNEVFKLQEQGNADEGKWSISNGFCNTNTISIPKAYYITVDVMLIPEGKEFKPPSKYLKLFKCKDRAEEIDKSLEQLLGSPSEFVSQRFKEILTPIQKTVSTSLDIIGHEADKKTKSRQTSTSGGSTSKKYYSTRHTRKNRSNKMSKAKTLRKRC